MNFTTFGWGALGGFIQALFGFIKSATVNGHDFDFWSFVKAVAVGAFTGGTVTMSFTFSPDLMAALAGLVGLGGGNLLTKLIEIINALSQGTGKGGK